MSDFFNWRKWRLVRLLDGRDGAGAVAQTLISNVTLQIVNIGTGVLSARLLQPVGRGEFAAILMVPQFVAALFSMGLPASVIYLSKRYPNHAPAYVGISLLISAVVGLTLATVATPLLPYWLHAYSPHVVRFAQFAAWLIPIGIAFFVLNSTLLVNAQYARYNIIRIGMPVSTLLGFFLLVTLGAFTAYSAAIVTLTAMVLMFALNLFWLTRTFSPRLTPFAAIARQLLSYGGRAWSIDLTGTLASQVDRVLVVALLAPAELGLYVVAQSAGRLIQLLPNSLLPVLFPRSTGRKAHEVVELTGFSVRATVLIMMPAVVVMLILAQVLLGWVYGAAFSDAAPVMRLLLLEAVLGGVSSVLTQAFMAIGRPGLVGVIQGASLPFTVLLLWLLVPRWGLEGAGMALVLAALARLLVTRACFRRVLGIPAPRLWPGLIDVRRILNSLRTMARRSTST